MSRIRSWKLREAVVKSQEFEKAAAIRDREEKLRLEKQRLEQEWADKRAAADKTLRVTEVDIAYIVSSWTRIPVDKLSQAETAKLLTMKEQLHKRVIGQDESVEVVTRAIRRSRAGLKNPKRPIGSFIFLGPTGVGKTEVARSLAEYLFDDSESMIRIDMSEYMEKYAVSRLVAHRRDTSATKRAANSRKPSGVAHTASCCSTRSRRRTRTCSTCCFRCSRTAGSRTLRVASSTSRTPSSS